MNKFTEVLKKKGIKPDLTKLNRQKETVRKWRDAKGKGTLEAVTGFGKTAVGIITALEVNRSKPDEKILVIVPSVYLKFKWEQDIEDFGVKNTEVLVINTAIKKKKSTYVLLLDEIHNYAAPTFKEVFKQIDFRFTLGLTCVLERGDGKEGLLKKHAPIIDTITTEEALENKWISNFTVYNLGIELSKEDKKKYDNLNKEFYYFFGFFNNDFYHCMTLLKSPEARREYADSCGWTLGEMNAKIFSWRRAMTAKNSFIYDHQIKLDTALDILKIFKERKSMTFCQTKKAVNYLTENSESLYYYSGLSNKKKEEILQKFKEEKYGILHTAKALDEGADIPNIDLAIIISGNSSKRQDIQRRGRGVRFVKNKRCLIVNLYLKDTQDETWIKKRQAGLKEKKWINNIYQIV